MSGLQYDVAIIGGGVTGAAVDRELSRYQLKICLVERAEDVCSGTSKANSAIVHAGYDAATGSLKAKMNVEGNEMMGQLSKDLDHRRTGGSAGSAAVKAQDRPGGGHVKSQPEQGGNQQQGGENRELQRLGDGHGDHQNHDGQGNIGNDQNVQQRRRKGDDQEEDNDHHEKCYAVLKNPPHGVILSFLLFLFM